MTHSLIILSKLKIKAILKSKNSLANQNRVLFFLSDFYSHMILVQMKTLG